MRYDSLRYFVEIAEKGSINKAAESLYVSQPNLSTAIRKLEEELDVKLLDRTSKGVQLTEIGKSIYFSAKRAFQELDRLETEKSLRVYSYPMHFSASIHGIFLSETVFGRFYRETDCDRRIIHVHEVGVEQVLSDVASSRSNLGVAVVNDLQLPSFKRVAAIKGLQYECIGKSGIFVLVGRFSPLYLQRETSIEHLLEFPQVHLPYDYFSTWECQHRIDTPATAHLDSFPRSVVMNHSHSMINLLQNSDAFLLSNKWGADDLQRENVHALRLSESDVRWHLMLVRRQRESFSSASAIFYRLFCEHYREI